MPDTAVSRSAFRFDGLADALAPFAGQAAAGYGRVAPSRFAASLWGDVSAELLYAEGGLAARLCDRPADDAVARGWDCEGDEAGLMADEWSRLDAFPVFADALRYAFRDGAAAVLVLCEDGPDLAEPLREDRLGAVTALRPLSGAQLVAGAYRYADPAHPRYGQPTAYRVRDLDGGGEYAVHETRLLRVPGEPVARAARFARDALPWAGRPRLSGQVAEDLRRYRDALAWLLTLLERKQQPVHAADGLAEMLAAADAERRVALAAGLAVPADDAYAVVRARARSVDLTRGTLGTVMVDGKDKFSVLDLGLGGCGEIMAEFKTALAASSNLPLTILFGDNAKGLNASDVGSHESYYQFIAQIQNRCLRPGVERLTKLLFRQGEFQTREPDRWRIIFAPMWTETAKEAASVAEIKARARKAEAEALSTVADLGVASPEELRSAARAVLPEYGFDDGGVPAAETAPEDDVPGAIAVGRGVGKTLSGGKSGTPRDAAGIGVVQATENDASTSDQD